MKIPKLNLILIAVGVLALPIAYTFEINYFNRTLHAAKLVVIAIVIGAIIGTWLGYRLQKGITDVVGKMRMYAVCVIGTILLMPLLLSWSNRVLSFHAVQQVPVEFVEESPRYASRFGVAAGERAQVNYYIIFFYKDQDLLNIHTTKPLFPDATRGDTVSLPIKKGLWFDVVQP